MIVAIDTYLREFFLVKRLLGFLLRNAHGISLTTGAGFLFVFKAWQQAHSRLRNCCHNTEDGRKDKRVVEVILCTFLTLLSSTNCHALDQLSFNLGSIVADKWQLKGVEFSFSGILEDTHQFSLNIQNLRLPEPLDTIKLVNIHCPEVKFREDGLECKKGLADVQSDWLNSPRIPFSFYLSKTNSRLNLEKITIAGGRVTLAASFSNQRWQTKLQATNLNLGVVQKKVKLGLFEPVKGKLDITINARGKGGILSNVDAHMSLKQGNIQAKDGRIATEKLKLVATIKAQMRNNAWHFNSQIEFQDGAIYAEPVYLETGSKPILLKLSGDRQEQGKNIVLDSVEITHPHVLTLNAQGRFGLNKEADGQVSLQVDDLKTASEVYIQPLFAATAMEGLGFSGKLKADVDIVQQTLTNLQLSFSHLGVTDSEDRVNLQGGIGEINWSKQAAPVKSKFSWQRLTMFSLPIDASEIYFTAAGNSFGLDQPAMLPLFDGNVVINKFAMTLKDSQKPDVHFQGAIRNVSLEQLTQTLNWQPLSGEINGEIPGVSFRDNKLGIDGALKVQVFDGEVIIKDLAVSGLFSPLPKFYTDVEINQLDLDQITSRFDFGNMQGRLSGSIQDMYLESWKPVTFYAWFGTPENDDSKHRISQKAVNNLASIGGGGAANLLSRTYLRFFEDFGYDKVGVGCYLYEGVCQLMGVGAAKQGYYIVKGGGLPRIDVIGYNSRVDWNVLMERLGRIAKSAN